MNINVNNININYETYGNSDKIYEIIKKYL